MPHSLDAFGEALPEGALARCGTLRFCHPPGNESGWPQVPRALCFSPDASRIATVAGETGYVWSREDGRLTAVLSGHQRRLNDVLYLSPTRIATAGDDRAVRVWDADSGAELKRWGPGCHGISRLALSPDGRTLLVGTWTPNGFAVLDAETGALLHRVRPEGSVGGPAVLAFSPDGSRVLMLERMLEDIRLCVFDAATWELQWATKRGFLETPLAWAAFSADGQCVRCPFHKRDWKPVVHEYDARTGELLGIASQQWGMSVLLADGAEARILNRRLVLFRDGALERWMSIPSAGFAEEWEPVVAPGGRWASFARGPAALVLLDLQSKKVWPEQAHRDSVTQLTFSRDGAHLLTYSGDGTVRTWERDSGRQVDCRTLEQTDARFIHLRRGRVLEVQGLGGVFLREVLAGTRVKVEGECSMYQTVWSDDCALLADLEDVHVEGERTVQVHDTRTGRQVRSVSLAVTDSEACALSRTGRFLVTPRRVRQPAPGHMDLCVWDLERRALRFVVPMGEGATALPSFMPQVGFSPDEAWLFFVDGEGGVVLVDLAGPERRVRLGSGTPVSAVAFSEDGTRVATGEVRGGVRVWSTDGRCLGALEGHRAGVRALAFSEEGDFLASGSADTTALLWPRSAWET